MMLGIKKKRKPEAELIELKADVKEGSDQLQAQNDKKEKGADPSSWEGANPVMFDDEDTSNVFEIISDLEKQLDVAFGIKDTQEDEIVALKKQLAELGQRAAMLDEKVVELKAALTSQEELNSSLEFLEAERLEASRKIRSLEEQLDQKSVMMEGLKGRIKAASADVKAKNIRIEQIELELTSSSKTARRLQRQIALLEQEKELLTGEVENAMEEMRVVIAERDKSRDELDRAKRGMDEIRGTLSKTRAKARVRYYKGKHKKIHQVLENSSSDAEEKAEAEASRT